MIDSDAVALILKAARVDVEHDRKDFAIDGVCADMCELCVGTESKLR